VKQALRTPVACALALVTLLGITTSGAGAKTPSLAQDLANALRIKAVPSSPVTMGGWSLDAGVIGAVASAYKSLAPANASSFASYQPSAASAARAGAAVGSLDIAFSDAPLNDTGQDTAAPGSFTQVPATLDSVAVLFHLGFATSDTVTNSFGSATTSNPRGAGGKTCTQLLSAHPLALDGVTLAQMFSGIITQWTNPAIVAQNPKLEVRVATPVAAAISATPKRRAVAQRNKLKPISCLSSAMLTTPTISLFDLSADVGPTFILRDYLNQVDPSVVPAASDDPFPAATAVESSPSAMAAAVSNLAGALGYVDASYAFQNSLATARLKNADGKVVPLAKKFVSVEALAALAAIKANPHCPGGFNAQLPSTYSGAPSTECFSLSNAPGAATAYPIAGVSLALVARSPGTNATAVAIAKFLEFLTQSGTRASANTTFGQNLASAQGDVPLPVALQSIAFAAITRITLTSGVSAVSASL